MKIYVACLASYNSGILHGEWIDIEGKDADEIREEINLNVLWNSPCPNVEIVCPACSGLCEPNDTEEHDCMMCKDTGFIRAAEEWAVHDYDGLPSSFGEYPDLDELILYAEAYAEHGDAWEAYCDYYGTSHATVSDFEERYQGQFDSPTDWAEQFLEDTGGLNEMPENLRYYFDFEKYARDAEYSGDITCVELNGSCFVFWNH